jgi:cell division protein FtsN
MNKSIRLSLSLAIVMLFATACKTQQKVAVVPSGAKITASSTPKTVTTTTPETSKTAVNETEVTRNENFSLVDGEKDALKYKYHVVVGSFSKIVNAQGLQKSLISEGNKALIVVNEKSMYRVLIASFNDYNQAHARIREISNRFADAWVLVQK